MLEEEIVDAISSTGGPFSQYRFLILTKTRSPVISVPPARNDHTHCINLTLGAILTFLSR